MNAPVGQEPSRVVHTIGDFNFVNRVPGRSDCVGRAQRRQIPGDDRANTIFPPMSFHTSTYVPRSPVRVIDGSGGSSKVECIAFMIFGIALTIIGICMFPSDLVGGIFIAGFGVLAAAAGAVSYSSVDG